MILIDIPSDVQEIGSSGWLTEDDGSETKLIYGQLGAGFYYAVTGSPQDDERDYVCWVGPYNDREAMEDAAWATHDDPTSLTETLSLPAARHPQVQP